MGASCHAGIVGEGGEVPEQHHRGPQPLGGGLDGLESRPRHGGKSGVLSLFVGPTMLKLNLKYVLKYIEKEEREEVEKMILILSI